MSHAAQHLKAPEGSLSLDDSFLGMGGDSLSAALVSAGLSGAGMHLSPSDLLYSLSLREAAGKGALLPGEGAPGDPFGSGRKALTLAMLRREDEKKIRERLLPEEPLLIGGLTPHMENLIRIFEERGPFFQRRLLAAEGEIDPFALEERLRLLSARHEALRTAFFHEGLSRARLVVLSRRGVPLTFTSLAGLSRSAREERIRAFAKGGENWISRRTPSSGLICFTPEAGEAPFS